MATKTINYNFVKPDNDDFYSIKVENENWDHADQQLKKLEEEKADADGGDISETKIKTFDQPIEEFPVPVAGDSVKGVAGKVKKFFEDFKAFKDGVITIGRLVNNGLTTKEGFALDARYGKTLADGLAKLNGELALHYMFVSYSNSNQEQALNQLNNPTLVLGQRETPYTILFHDDIGDSPLGGGVSCIYGYTYADGRYGAQLSMKYSASKPLWRNKNNGVWSAWTSL